MTNFPQLVIGTYEEFVLGYNLQFDNEKKLKFKLHQSFATHSHQASVRCIATHNALMASSGADEYINVYDMAAMEVSTVINYHDSTVTCLEFTPDGSHLVTANQNGDIAIFRCNDWVLVKLWKAAHKDANGVTSICIHPTGSLLLTTGGDNIVRFWNLVKGRQAYAINFIKKCSPGKSLNFGIWSRNGKYYAVCVGDKLEIYKTETASLFYEIIAKAKITCSTFTKKNLISVATENGFLEIHSISKKKILIQKQAHNNRIKSLALFDLNIFDNEKNITRSYIVSVDSKGGIKIWCLKINKKKLKFLLLLKGEANCDCRITCLSTVHSNIIKIENDFAKVASPEIITNNQDAEINVEESSKNVHYIKTRLKNKSKKLKKIIEDCSSLKQKTYKKFKNGF